MLRTSLLLLVLSLMLFAGSAAGQGVSPRCEAAMDRAAGEYSRCLLGADADSARHENLRKRERRQARCERRFDRRTSRAINVYGENGCPSSRLVAVIKERTVSFAESVSTEARGVPAPSYLIVLNGTGGTLSETTLTLTGADSKTQVFSDRPYRKSWQDSTADFLAQWDEGENSFADDPPNADFTCEVGDGVVNYVVELTSPSLVGGDLTYAVNAVGDTLLPTGGDSLVCNGVSSLFVDNRNRTASVGASTGRWFGAECDFDSQCGSGRCGVYEGDQLLLHFRPEGVCTHTSINGCLGDPDLDYCRTRGNPNGRVDEMYDYFFTRACCAL